MATTSKAIDNRPARKRYWSRRTLEKRKVANLLDNNQPKKKGGKPMSAVEAMIFWHKARKGRVLDGYLKDYSPDPEQVT